jgi:hypothetical protein
MSGDDVLSTLKKISAYEMTIAEWIGLAVLLSTPYLAIGVIWSIGHAHGVVQFITSTLTWPWLMFPSVVCTGQFGGH